MFFKKKELKTKKMNRIIKELFECTDKADQSVLADCFVSLSCQNSMVFPLLKYFIDDEFTNGGIAGSVMRENVIASKLIKVYLRMSVLITNIFF